MVDALFHILGRAGDGPLGRVGGSMGGEKIPQVGFPGTHTSRGAGHRGGPALLILKDTFQPPLFFRIPVSYTHLDVYKRQTPNPQNSKFRNSKWATFSYKVKGKTYQSQNRIQVPMASQVGTTISVRYDINHPEKLYSFSVSRIVVSFLIAVVCAALAMSNFM